VRIQASVDGRRVAAAILAYRFSEAASDPAAARACRRMHEFYTMITSHPLGAVPTSDVSGEAGHA
jgi:hypothetical protein